MRTQLSRDDVTQKLTYPQIAYEKDSLANSYIAMFNNVLKYATDTIYRGIIKKEDIFYDVVKGKEVKKGNVFKNFAISLYEAQNNDSKDETSNDWRFKDDIKEDWFLLTSPAYLRYNMRFAFARNNTYYGVDFMKVYSKELWLDIIKEKLGNIKIPESMYEEITTLWNPVDIYETQKTRLFNPTVMKGICDISYLYCSKYGKNANEEIKVRYEVMELYLEYLLGDRLKPILVANSNERIKWIQGEYIRPHHNYAKHTPQGKNEYIEYLPTKYPVFVDCMLQYTKDLEYVDVYNSCEYKTKLLDPDNFEPKDFKCLKKRNSVFTQDPLIWNTKTPAKIKPQTVSWSVSKEECCNKLEYEIENYFDEYTYDLDSLSDKEIINMAAVLSDISQKDLLKMLDIKSNLPLFLDQRINLVNLMKEINEDVLNNILNAKVHKALDSHFLTPEKWYMTVLKYKMLRISKGFALNGVKNKASWFDDFERGKRPLTVSEFDLLDTVYNSDSNEKGVIKVSTRGTLLKKAEKILKAKDLDLFEPRTKIVNIQNEKPVENKMKNKSEEEKALDILEQFNRKVKIKLFANDDETDNNVFKFIKLLPADKLSEYFTPKLLVEIAKSIKEEYEE